MQTGKRALGVLLAVLMVVTTLTPGLLAGAASTTITITQDGVEVTDQLTVQEYRSIELSYTTAGDVPADAYVTWESSQPLLAGVDSNGKVSGYDYSKAAIVQQWIDENIRSLPLVGESMAQAIEDQIAATGVDLEDMDTAVLIGIIRAVAGDTLADSLQAALDSMNVEITATLHSADGQVLATDTVKVVVEKSVLADLVPTAVHITNKNSVPTTVAVGTTVQLYGAVTPVRIHEGVKWTMGDTIFDTESGKHATVSSDGLVTFTSVGTVKVRVNPDNVLYSAFTDTITFTVVDPSELPVTDFSIVGETEIDEGETTQLAIDNLTPAGAYTGDLKWESSDPTVAVVDQNGIVTGLDGGNDLITYSRKTTITATIGSVSKSVEVKVNRQLLNSKISGVEIVGDTDIPNNSSTTYTAKITPDRLNSSSSVQREWGLTNPLTGETVWATAETPADTNIATITADGVLTPKQSGVITIHARATQDDVVLETTKTVEAGTPIESFTLELGGGFSNLLIGFNTERALEEGHTGYIDIKNILPAEYDPDLLNNVIWTTSDPSVATVNENGMVFGMDAGGLTVYHSKSVTITASIGGVSASITFNVRGASVNNLVAAEITGNNYVIKDFPISYSAIYSPPRLSVNNAHWGLAYDDGSRPWEDSYDSTSGNQQNSIATVDNNGLVTGLSAGETTLYYFVREGLTSWDGSYAEDTKNITVVELEPKSITLTAPTRTDYVEGETELDLTGLKVELNYDKNDVAKYYDISGMSDSDFTVEVHDYTVGEINQTILDNEQYILVTVTRAGKSYRGVFPITLASKNLTDISLVNPRYKYLEGENKLDLTGLEVTANYSNAASEKVTDYTVDYAAFDPDVLDVEQNINVTYEHAGRSATASFPIMIYGIPVVSVDTGAYEGGWTSKDVTFTLSATHPLDGLTYYYKTASNPEWVQITGDTLTVSQDCNETYYFKAVNSAGIESAETAGYTVMRDAVTPSFNLVPEKEDLTNTSYTVQISDLQVGISGIRSVKLNGADITENHDSFTATQNGDYIVEVIANNGLSLTKTLNVTNIDTTAPTVDSIDLQQKISGGFARRIDGAFGLFFNAQVEVTIAASDEGVAGVDRIEYRYFDATTDTYTDWAVYDASNKPLQDLNFKGWVEARAYDKAGNVSATLNSEGYVIDTEKPTAVTITATSEGENYEADTWAADDVSMKLESIAFSGIYEYQYRVDNGEWQTLDGDTLTATEPGTHRYEVKAVSYATNESEITEMVVKIDKQKPVIRVAFDGTFGRWTADGARFNFSTEEESLSGITYYYNDGTGWYEFDGSELVLSENTNTTYTFKAVNGAGTESTTSDSYRVMIDTVKPTVELEKTVTSLTSVPYEVRVNTTVGEAGLESITVDGKDITAEKAFTVSENGAYLVTVTGNNGKWTSVILEIDNFCDPELKITDISFSESVKQDKTPFGIYFNTPAEITISALNTTAVPTAEISYRLVDENNAPVTEWTTYNDESKPVIDKNFRGYVEARVTDTEGNRSETYLSHGITVELETPDAPTVTAVSAEKPYISDTWTDGHIDITLDWDAVSGVVTYYYQKDGGEWKPMDENSLTVYETGTHVWNFKAVSVLGKESGVSTLTTKIENGIPVLQVGVNGAIGVETSRDITFTLYTPNALSDITYYYTTGNDEWIEMDGNVLEITEDTTAVYQFKAVNEAGEESYESLEYSVILKHELTEIVVKDGASAPLKINRENPDEYYMVGLNVDNATVASLKSDLKNESVQVHIYRDGEELSDGEKVGTGCVVQYVASEDPMLVYESVTVILYGDVNGDGVIDDADYDLMKQDSVSSTPAIDSGVFETAADLNNDGVVDCFDAAILNLQLVGVKDLDQTVDFYK